MPDQLTVVGDMLYLSASDGEHGIELWKSDGTEEGTVMVKDLTPGSDGSTELYWFVAVDEHLIFVNGDEIWRSNGTACSTLPIGNGGTSFVDQFQPVVVGDKLYFIASGDESGTELYYYDFSTINDPGCTQTITFGALSTKIFGDVPFEPSRQLRPPGLPITFSVPNNDVVVIEGNKVTIKAGGEVVITASQQEISTTRPHQRNRH
ncbi:MAG: ELWxxDGT repeat protein [Bacteroidota bacterium]